MDPTGAWMVGDRPQNSRSANTEGSCTLPPPPPPRGPPAVRSLSARQRGEAAELPLPPCPPQPRGSPAAPGVSCRCPSPPAVLGARRQRPPLGRPRRGLAPPPPPSPPSRAEEQGQAAPARAWSPWDVPEGAPCTSPPPGAPREGSGPPRSSWGSPLRSWRGRS